MDLRAGFNRFRRLYQPWSGRYPGIDIVFENLVQAYSEPGRHYHTLDHIEACLRELNQHKSDMIEPDTVELALWFHDAVYDTRASGNEEKSAALCGNSLNYLFPDPMSAVPAILAGRLDKAATYIMHTTHRTHPPILDDAGFVMDIDLAILGQPPEVYAEYVGNIRKEYAWVPDGSYRVGRAAVLASLLASGQIYCTDVFRAKYERQAQANVMDELAMLRGAQ